MPRLEINHRGVEPILQIIPTRQTSLLIIRFRQAIPSIGVQVAGLGFPQLLGHSVDYIFVF